MAVAHGSKLRSLGRWWLWLAALALPLLVYGLWILFGRLPETPIAGAPPAEVAPPQKGSSAAKPPVAAENQRSPVATLPVEQKKDAETCDRKSPLWSSAEGVGRTSSGQAGALSSVAAIARGLATSADVRAKATGLFISTSQLGMDLSSCPNNDCTKVLDDFSYARQRDVNQLALLATASTDPLVYQLALEACASPLVGSQKAGACEGISPERWAQIEPASIWPQFALAAKAARANDVGGQETAFANAAQSTAWKDHRREANEILLGAVVASGAQPITVINALTTVAQHDSTLSGLTVASKFCGQSQDANRAQTCARLAQIMLENGDSLLSIKVALKMGEQSGMHASALELYRSELIQLENAAKTHLNTISSEQTSSADVSGCTSEIRLKGYLKNTLVQGERRALRALSK